MVFFLTKEKPLMLSDMKFCSPSFNPMVSKGPNFGGSTVTSPRDQCVGFKDTILAPLRLSFGAPQGSVLGPTLFNIHINNISKACHTSTVSLYADDTEMHSSSKDIDLAEHNVNKDLRSVRHWFRRNGLICKTKRLKPWLLRP